MASRRGKTKVEKVCAECGETFTGANRARYCAECVGVVKRRRDAEAHARHREKRRGELPPVGPVERAEIREHCEPYEVRLLVRDVREMELLLEIFPGRSFTMISPARSKKSGDVDNFGRHDAASREYGTEKLIVAPGGAGGRESRYEKDQAWKVLGAEVLNHDAGKE